MIQFKVSGKKSTLCHWTKLLLFFFLGVWKPIQSIDFEEIHRDQEIMPKKTRLEKMPLFDNWLGIRAAREGSRVKIMEIFPDSPAERGHLQLWDYLEKINGQRIRSAEDLEFVVNSVPPGTLIVINYDRASGNGSVTIKVEKRETIKDMIGRHVKNKLSFEIYSNDKPYDLEFRTGQIKVLYFMANIDGALEQQAAHLAAEVSQSKLPGIEFFAITFMSCVKVTVEKPVTGKSFIQQICHERRLPENAVAPFEMYYDRQGIAFLTFRVERKPSIVVIDRENVVRFAEYADKDSIARAINTVQILRQEKPK